jgi:hypothetical protein
LQVETSSRPAAAAPSAWRAGTARTIARWNGEHWAPLGSLEAPEYGFVWGLAVYDGELVAAGNFDTADGIPVTSVARWDGSSWSSMGAFEDTAGINALAVYGDELIAGGALWSPGISNLARWNGASW